MCYAEQAETFLLVQSRLQSNHTRHEFPKEFLLPFGSRRRALARRVYKKLAALKGKPSPTHSLPPASLTPHACTELEEDTLRSSFFNRQPPGYLETEQGWRDLADHLNTRLQIARTQVIPWLELVRQLNGARVLEIGCGTGSSLVALAERGAEVIGMDLDEDALQVAHKRCALHGVNAELHAANATNVAELFSNMTFDFIIFYASLEHIVHEERLRAISDTWAMLRPGDLWCLVETPTASGTLTRIPHGSRFTTGCQTIWRSNTRGLATELTFVSVMTN